MRFAFILFMVLSFSMSSHAAIVATSIPYKDNGTELSGTLVYDNSVTTPKAGIVLFPEWWGHNDYIKRRAHEMAEQGYIAFAADMYGKDKVTNDAKVAQEWSKPFYENRALMRQRAKAALSVLQQQPQVDKNAIALIGFCMGGTVALELARAGENVKGVATFHAGLQFPVPLEKGKIKAKLLVMNGAADPMVPFADRQKFIEETQNAGGDLQFIEYGNALHAFTNPEADSKGIAGIAYNAPAERRSFQALKTFLAEIFL